MLSAGARSGQVQSPGRKERAQDQLLEHDLFAKVVSTFGVHALGRQPGGASRRDHHMLAAGRPG
jgi:hypothetical protein